MEQLLPLFLSLLKDDWPDVRLAIIGKLQAVNQVRLWLLLSVLARGCSPRQPAWLPPAQAGWAAHGSNTRHSKGP